MAWPSSGSYTAWSKCYEVVSQASKIDEALPWYFLDLSTLPSSFWSAVQSDGRDIRFTQDDGETAVYHKLIFIDTGTSKGLVAIAQPHGSGGASSNISTFCYVGNSGASSTSSSSSFQSTLEALYMLQEDPTTAGNTIDWTSNARHSTAVAGAMTSGDLLTTGPHAGLKCVDFDSNDRITVPASLFSACISNNAYTFFAWVYPTVNTSDYGIFGSAGALFAVAFKTSTPWYSLYAQSRNSANSAYFSGTAASADNMDKNRWQLVHVVYNGSTLKGYVDGVEVWSSSATSLRNTSLSFYIGMDNTTYSRCRIAEVGMVSAAYSANAISTMYKNEKDAGFWSSSEVTGSTSIDLTAAITSTETTTVAASVEMSGPMSVSAAINSTETTTVAASVSFTPIIDLTAVIVPDDLTDASASVDYLYSTGPLTGPFTVSQSGSGISWTLSSIAYLSTFMTYPSTTKKLRILNPAPTYPPGAVLQGLKVQVSHACTDDDDSIKDSTFYLVVAGSPDGTNSPDSHDWLTFSGNYGGESSKFGIPTLSIEDTISANFGIELDAVKTANNGLFGIPEVGSVSFEFFYTVGPVVVQTQKFLPFYH